MRACTKIALFCAVLMTLALVMTGCGGGSGAARTPPPDSTLFVPNYVSSLDNLLHWNHLPMKVYFNLPSNWSALYPGNTDLYIRAADEWNWPGQQQLIQVVSSAIGADVTVDFVNTVSGSSADTAGVTSTTYSSRTMEIQSANIQVGLRDQHDNPEIASWVQLATAHELGHALGIDGHSPVQSDLMYYAHASGETITPTERDMNTAKSAYPSYFGKAAVPLMQSRSIQPDELRTVIIH